MERAIGAGAAGFGERAYSQYAPLSILRSMRQALARRRIYRRTLRELRALSRRDLDDLGICPEMITRLALEAAHGRKEHIAPTAKGATER